MSEPKINTVFVAALGRNRAIGLNGRLPWHLPGDLAHFRRATLGKPLLVGRKTWEGLGGFLPEREMIVISRRGYEARKWEPLSRDRMPKKNLAEGIVQVEGVRQADSPAAALALGRQRALALGAGEVCVLGGGELFAALLPAADVMVLTWVEAEPEADVWFPAFRAEDWRETCFTRPVPHPKDECAYIFSVLQRAA